MNCLIYLLPAIWSQGQKMYEGRTESHEQHFLYANWEQQTKEGAVVDGTSCCVILEYLVTSIACIMKADVFWCVLMCYFMYSAQVPISILPWRWTQHNSPKHQQLPIKLYHATSPKTFFISKLQTKMILKNCRKLLPRYMLSPLHIRGSYRKSWATFFCMRTGSSRRRRVLW